MLANEINRFRQKVKSRLEDYNRKPCFLKSQIEIIDEENITFLARNSTIGNITWDLLTPKELVIVDEYLLDQITKSNLEQLSKKDIDLLIECSKGWGCVECTNVGTAIEDCELRKLLLRVGETCSAEK